MSNDSSFKHSYDIQKNAESYQYDGRPPRVVREIIIIQAQPTLRDFLPTLGLIIIYMLIIQTICTIVYKVNKRVYNNLVFLMLSFFPPLILFMFGHVFFPLCWFAFVIFMGYVYCIIRKKPMGKEIPRKTYNLFRYLFIGTNFGIFIAQSSTFISFFTFPEYVFSFFNILLFFMYFGLLSREVILKFSEVMATNTGFYSKEGVPGRSNNNSLCMICTKVFDNTELIHTLVCGHSFHENCIKGWCMIAKKGFCPYCKKGVDMKTIPADLWSKTEVWFYPLINTLRNFIVFSMSMCILILYKYHTM